MTESDTEWKKKRKSENHKKKRNRLREWKKERKKDRNKKRVRETMKIPKDRKTEDITLSEISIYLQRRLQN